MHTALYYPYASVPNRRLLRTTLLLWDQIQVIDPVGACRYSKHPMVREAQELVVRRYAPSEDEQLLAHRIIMEFMHSPLPDRLFVHMGEPRDHVYRRKFSPRTWDALLESRLAGPWDVDRVYTSLAMSMILMAILAECCAGETKRLVTDETGEYDRLRRSFGARTDGAVKTSPDPEDRLLVSLTIRMVDVSAIPLHNLVRLRKKELGPSGHLYTQVRHALLGRLEAHALEMVKPTYSISDRQEIERCFEQEMANDYADLAEELGLAGRKFVLSGEFAALVALVASAFTQPSLAGTPAGGAAFILGAGGILADLLTKYRAHRKRTLLDHPTASLYLAEHAGFEQDLR